MDEARVVEIWVPAAGRVGSGYLLSDRLVLTAHHVVHGIPVGAPVDVRPLSVGQPSPWLSASLYWPTRQADLAAAPDCDAALLVIDDPLWDPGLLRGTVRFGQVTGQDRVACLGLGFPDAEARPDNSRDSMPVRGTSILCRGGSPGC